MFLYVYACPHLEFSDKVRILTVGSFTGLSVIVSTSYCQVEFVCSLLQGKMSASCSPNKTYIGQNGNKFHLNLFNEAAILQARNYFYNKTTTTNSLLCSPVQERRGLNW